MFFEGIPLILVNNLDMLFKENQLSSWQVRSGQQYTQVTIRFNNMEARPAEGEVIYRRASPSQIARDRQRTASRMQTQDKHLETDCYNSDHNRAKDNVAACNFASEDIGLEACADKSCPTVTGHPIPAESHVITTSSDIDQQSQLNQSSAVLSVCERPIGGSPKSGKGDKHMTRVRYGLGTTRFCEVGN